MELSVKVVSAAAVRDLIARGAFAADTEGEPSSANANRLSIEQLGSVRLHPHQVSAVQRLERAMNEFGGALLCDEVGMGKTFVALAIARRFVSPVVVAPAVLMDMWSQQSKLAGVELPFISFESLSRGRRLNGTFDLVLIDEAHQVRNPSAKRYKALCRLAARSQVLMLSATPIHNRRRDLTALLSIFLGSQGESLPAADLARCVVRRRVGSAGFTDRMPETAPLVWRNLRDDEHVLDLLRSLPPPVPPRSGGDGGVLVVRSLIRQWCSSEAALDVALRSRLAKSSALIAALESGHYPSRNELSAWTAVDDTLQLAFPSIVAPSPAPSSALLEAVQVHAEGVRAVLHSLDPTHPRDVERGQLLEDIRRNHAGVPIVAFSQYATTVAGLFRVLRSRPRIAMLTGARARVAGGSITRREAISRFAPRASGTVPSRDAERIDLLLTTDLLSEGVNLQDAGVVVHLDLPWTPARLEQRIGRVARMGSVHRRVSVYGIRPPAAVEQLIRIEATIRAKMREAEASVGLFRHVLPAESLNEVSRLMGEPNARLPAVSTTTERIREVLECWRASNGKLRLPLRSAETRVAAVAARQEGFLALCRHGAGFVLLASNRVGISDDPAHVLELLLDADGEDLEPQPGEVKQCIADLESHFRTRQIVGLADSQAASVAQKRRAALRRLETILHDAKPHARARLIPLGETARNAILGRLGAAAESDLLEFVTAELPNEEWLRTIASYSRSERDEHPPTRKARIPFESPTVSAILLMHVIRNAAVLHAARAGVAELAHRLSYSWRGGWSRSEPLWIQLSMRLEHGY